MAIEIVSFPMKHKSKAMGTKLGIATSLNLGSSWVIGFIAWLKGNNDVAIQKYGLAKLKFMVPCQNVEVIWMNPFPFI